MAIRDWKHTATTLLEVLRLRNQTVHAELGPLRFERVDYATASEDDEQAVLSRNTKAMDARDDREASCTGTLALRWGPAGASVNRSTLEARIQQVRRESRTLMDAEGRGVIWQGQSSWVDGSVGSRKQHMRADITLHSAQAEYAFLLGVIENLGRLVNNPPPKYAAGCALMFPVAAEAPAAVRGSLWLVSEALRSKSETNPTEVWVVGDRPDKPIRTQAPPLNAADWRKLYGEIRRTVREGLTEFYRDRAFYVVRQMLLFSPNPTERGALLEPFSSGWSWMGFVRSVDVLNTAITALDRLLSPVVVDAPRDLVTKEGAADRLGVGARTIYRRIGDGLIMEYGPKKKVSLEEVRKAVVQTLGS